jgi:tetratricopeptide (TPR) repeat protein
MARPRRTISIAAGTFGAVALVAAGVLAWAWPRVFPSTLERGRAAYGLRDWPRAEALARDALREKPADRDALRLLARSSGRLGRDETARAVYSKLAPEPPRAEDYLVIAASHLRRGDPGSALRLLEKGHGLDPDHADILHFLITYDTSMGHLARAEELAARLARQPGQGARGELLLGVTRDRLSDPVGAAEALEKALQLDPTLKDLEPAPIPARKLLARDYLKAGRSALARSHLDRVLGEGPDPEASWLMSRAWLQEGSPGSAASALGLAGRYGLDRPTDPEPSPYVGSGECAGCHEAIHQAQQSSRHARTFWAGAALARLPIPAAAVPDPVDPKAIDHRARLEGDRVIWETRVGESTATALLVSV